VAGKAITRLINLLRWGFRGQYLNSFSFCYSGFGEMILTTINPLSDNTLVITFGFTVKQQQEEKQRD
jgi:hypothetical protein